MERSVKCLEAKELYWLTAKEPMVAFFLQRSKVNEYSEKEAKEKFGDHFTAAISMRRGRIHLELNSDAMLALTPNQRLGVLVHEFLHVALLHCTHRVVQDKEKHKKMNIAMDMAINQMIRGVNEYDLPKGAIDHRADPFKFPDGLTAEGYFELLDRHFTDEQLEQYVSFDSHGGFGGDDSEFGKATLKELAKAYAKSKAYQNGGNDGVFRTAGSGHGSILETLLSIEVNDIPWQVYAKRFMQKVLDSRRRFTMKRPSRRFGFPMPGEKTKVMSKVAAIVDTSGSMSSSFISHIGGQLNLMSKIMRVDVIFCDAAVQGGVKKFRPTKELSFPGRGGTVLEPAFEMAEQEGYRGIVCFTDGGLFSEPKCNIPTLWVCVNNTSFNPPFGNVVHVQWND